jgi:cobalt-zinc-cadmium efflux system membrane fusion protein
LTPSEPAIKIVDTDHIHLELNVFERDLPALAVGQDIRFRIQESKESEYDATVYLINKVIDPEKRTVGIHGHLVDENLAKRLNPGMYVEADIYTTSDKVWSLPKDALVEIDGVFYVLVLQDRTESGYTFLKREVKTGASNDSQIEIMNTADFIENEEFLINGAFNLITE